MSVGPVGAVPILPAASFSPALTREEMVAITAARPAVVQQQHVALAPLQNGTTGDGTPPVDSAGHVNLLA
jgi:hypothetical protein